MPIQGSPHEPVVQASAGASAPPAPAIAEPARSVGSDRVLRSSDYPIYLVLTGLMLAALVVFLRYWFSLDFDVITVLLTLAFLYAIGIQILTWLLLPTMRRPRPMPVREGWRVGVATTFVPGAESIEMLEETLVALVALEYPHETWVLDEEDDHRVRELCHSLGARHFTRKHLPHYQAESGTFQSRSKIGNFNAWFQEVAFERYDIIVGFDPDHVPAPVFLLHMLGYFDDPRIGYVQAAQVYYNQEASFIARGAAEESYGYYSVSQMASYAGGYPIITGSHNAHRVAALKAVGGFPPHDADDLMITLLYRAAGWEGVYVPKVLAHGITPVDWPGYLKQQLRWARSVLDVKFRAFPRLASHLPRKERLLGFLHGFYYLQGLWTVVLISVLAVMLITGVTPATISYTTLAYLLLLVAAFLPARAFTQRFFLDWRRERGLHLRSRVLRAAKWPYLLLALVDTILDRKRPYALTPKVKGAGRQPMLLWPHLVVAAVIAGAWAVGIARGHDLHPLLHLWAGFTVLSSLALVWTERWSYPAPYDRQLWKRHQASATRSPSQSSAQASTSEAVRVGSP
ncbi:hypothetical protein BH23GEM7_BH23GEM7_03730 [soil metagenome]